MTTVAWDGKQLAADKMGLCSGRKGILTKIFRLQDGRLFGFAGCPVAGNLAREWLDGSPDKERPKLKEDAIEGILITPEGLFGIWEELVPVKLQSKVWAIGSGGSFALAALTLGKSAVVAIELASQLDTNTGMGIDVLSLGIP